jgi:hypothetical protein
VGNPQVGQQLLQAVLAHLRSWLQGFQDRHDILGHREFPEHRRLLGEVLQAQPGPAINGQQRDVLAVQVDLAAVGLQQPQHHEKVLVLPAPLGQGPTTSPLFTSMETPSTTLWPS